MSAISVQPGEPPAPGPARPGVGRPGAGRPRPGVTALLPTILLVVVIGVVVLGPLVWAVDPRTQTLTARLQGPSVVYPLGTDALGRDLLARVLHGGRLSLGVSLVITLMCAAIGVGLGSLAASRGGFLDQLLTRLIDILLAFPFLILALVVSGLSGGGINGIVLALGLFGWGTYARLARVETARIRVQPFVESARVLGQTPVRTFLRHVLPNAMPSLLVLAVARYGQTILTIAGLSFLGVGVKPPTPEWGAMLAEALPFLERAPHVLLAPALAVTVSCFAVSLAAESWRRFLDPTSRSSRAFDHR
ncbi:MAG: ABC transporter permease [Chloroflexi bacterium]|nr:ABC transporter permease [Chloroflexota bacterium]